VDYIGVHAYGSEQDFFMNGPDRDYYALRYRKIRAATLAAGYDKPFVLTETGTWSGWKGKVPVGDVAQDYLWLEGEIERDDYVLGQVPFLLDGFDWDSFKLLGSSAVDRFAAHNAGKLPAIYATITPTPLATATSTPTLTPTPLSALDEARPHVPWLREVAKLPPADRALAIQQAARELGVSVLTVYEWLTWLEVNGELGVLAVTPTPIPTGTPAVTPTPSPVATLRALYQVFLPGILHGAISPEPSSGPLELRRGGIQ
jgi:hypothetical protein